MSEEEEEEVEEEEKKEEEGRILKYFCSFVQQPQTSTTSNLNDSNLRSASKTK